MAGEGETLQVSSIEDEIEFYSPSASPTSSEPPDNSLSSLEVRREAIICGSNTSNVILL